MTVEEYFKNGYTAQHKPQIIAGGDMDIKDFSSAANIGGVLAASQGTMTITGSGTFTNDDLSLNIRKYTIHGTQITDCTARVCPKEEKNPRSFVRKIAAHSLALPVMAVKVLGFLLIN